MWQSGLETCWYLMQLLIRSSVKEFIVWWEKQWGREKHVGVKLATTLFALRRERTAFVMVLWGLSQSKWSLILCKLVLVQVPVWWLTLMMPNPNFNIHSQTKMKLKAQSYPRAPELLVPIIPYYYYRWGLKKHFFFNQFTVLLICENGHYWIVA